MKPLENTVYPSKAQTIFVENEDDPYGGAHSYVFTNCLGFSNGETQYHDTQQYLQFVQKLVTGVVIPGVQSEQLVIALIDRQKKLNALYPSQFNDKAIKGLEMFLEAQRERVEDRINRGVMGNLQK